MSREDIGQLIAELEVAIRESEEATHRANTSEDEE
jgi:hypothetical protein